jgi:DNA mismatch repair ATPase MutS
VRPASYDSFRERHPEGLLLFPCDGGYACYGNDAMTAARALNLTVVRPADRVPVTTFPAAELGDRLRDLVAAGHRCAVCDPQPPARQEPTR